MCKPLIVEEESGVITRTRHPHNGYYAGDFSSVPRRDRQHAATWVPSLQTASTGRPTLPGAVR